MIRNETQRAQAIERIENLVNQVEDYDRRKHEIDAEKYHSFFEYKHIDLVKELNRRNADKLKMHIKGSFGPMWHPLDDSGPRGYVFFRSIEKNNPDNLTPEEAGMSKGRCPI